MVNSLNKGQGEQAGICSAQEKARDDQSGNNQLAE